MPNSIIDTNLNKNNGLEVRHTGEKFTEKGTKIVKPGQMVDKNAFFMILAAELKNQDPTSAKDGTEYISQMAQFAGVEQMTNLNGNMKFMGSTSLINKVVMLNKMNPSGNLYIGKVKGISRDGDNVKLNVIVGQEKDEDGNFVDDIMQFQVEDVLELINNPLEEANNTNVEEKNSHKDDKKDDKKDNKNDGKILKKSKKETA